MDKNKREKDRLLEMARRQEPDRSCFTLWEENACTYFLERRDDNYLKEYEFETAPQLRSLLQKEIGFGKEQEELLKIIMVAAFKNQFREGIIPEEKEKNSVQAETREALSAFIYNM